mgnify:CR=1 FL=1
MKKFALAIFLALTLVSAVVLAEKDYFPIAQQALRDAQAESISDDASLPKGFIGLTFSCTMPILQKPGKDPLWHVLKFESQSEIRKGVQVVDFTRLVIITVDRKGQTTRNECPLFDGVFTR